MHKQLKPGLFFSSSSSLGTRLIASLLVMTHWYVATVSGSQVLPYEGRRGEGGRGGGRGRRREGEDVTGLGRLHKQGWFNVKGTLSLCAFTRYLQWSGGMPRKKSVCFEIASEAILGTNWHQLKSNREDEGRKKCLVC